jgi:hypothetical protein
MEKFSNYVHPDKGVRFSPYAYVEPDQDLTFSADEVKALLSDNSKRQWGYYDGSGDSINMTFQQYFRRFVYTHDFSNTEDIYYNVISKKGNTTDNSREIYPDAVIVEYHVPASDPSKMDWASLRLVLEEYNDDWYVTGLIHDEWTI